MLNLDWVLHKRIGIGRSSGSKMFIKSFKDRMAAEFFKNFEQPGKTLNYKQALERTGKNF